MNDDMLKSCDECAAWLGISRQTVWRWEKMGMPSVTLHSGKKRFWKAPIWAWMIENNKAQTEKNENVT